MKDRERMAARHVPGRALRDWSLSVASVCLLVLIVMGLDHRVGGLVSSFHARPQAAIGTAGDQVGSWAGTAIEAARVQVTGHTSLTLFAIAGVALVVVMLRISR